MSSGHWQDSNRIRTQRTKVATLIHLALDDIGLQEVCSLSALCAQLLYPGWVLLCRRLLQLSYLKGPCEVACSGLYLP